MKKIKCFFLFSENVGIDWLCFFIMILENEKIKCFFLCSEVVGLDWLYYFMWSLRDEKIRWIIFIFWGRVIVMHFGTLSTRGGSGFVASAARRNCLCRYRISSVPTHSFWLWPCCILFLSYSFLLDMIMLYLVLIMSFPSQPHDYSYHAHWQV